MQFLYIRHIPTCIFFTHDVCVCVCVFVCVGVGVYLLLFTIHLASYHRYMSPLYWPGVAIVIVDWVQVGYILHEHATSTLGTLFLLHSCDHGNTGALFTRATGPASAVSLVAVIIVLCSCWWLRLAPSCVVALSMLAVHCCHCVCVHMCVYVCEVTYWCLYM